MSPHADVFELLSAYALDALDEADANVVRAHVAECAICQAELAQLYETVNRLANVLPSPHPSADLRGRVLAAIEREAHPARQTALPKRPASRVGRLQLVWAALAIALVLGEAWLVINVISLQAQNKQLDEIQDFLLSAEPPIWLESPDPTLTAHGYYRMEANWERGLFYYYNLPMPGPGQSYVCWFEVADGSATFVGRLPLESDGHGLLLVNLPETRPTHIRVTLETGETVAPTGPSVLIADVPNDE